MKMNVKIKKQGLLKEDTQNQNTSNDGFAISADDKGFFRKINELTRSAAEARGETISINSEKFRLEGGKVDTKTGLSDADRVLAAELAAQYQTDQGELQALADDEAEKEYEKFMRDQSTNNIITGSWEDFLNTFITAVASQFGIKLSYRSYAISNKRNGDDPNDSMLYPGTGDYKIYSDPEVDVYIDASGSWRNSEAEKYGDQLIEALEDLAASGHMNIKLNKLFFGDKISTDKDSTGNGGTTAWALIQKDILAKKPSNVIFITDSDMGHQGIHGRTVTPPGNVWYIWGNLSPDNWRYEAYCKDVMIPELHSSNPTGTYQFFLRELKIN